MIEQPEDAAATGENDRDDSEPARTEPTAVEVGGREGLDPTRYGDWEKNGRCIDF